MNSNWYNTPWELNNSNIIINAVICSTSLLLIYLGNLSNGVKIYIVKKRPYIANDPVIELVEEGTWEPKLYAILSKWVFIYSNPAPKIGKLKNMTKSEIIPINLSDPDDELDKNLEIIRV